MSSPRKDETAAPARPVVPMWKRPLYALVVLVVAAALAEGAARLFVPEERLQLLANPTEGHPNADVPDVFAYDADLFWVLRPNLRLEANAFWKVRTNALGLRSDTEVPVAKTKPRVLCLGDSCTYGLGVTGGDAWPSHLADAYESINAGVPGYSSFQGTRYLERLTPQLAPDCVVIDFGANDGNPWPTHDRGHLVTLTDRERARNIALRELLTRSRFLAFVSSLVAPARPVPIDDVDPRDFTGMPVRVPVDEFRANLRTMARGAPAAVIVAWPRRSVLDPPHLDPVPRERSAAYHRAALDLASEGLRVVDVAEVFKKSGVAPGDFYLDEVHATPLGCRLVGAAVAAAVKDVLAARR